MACAATASAFLGLPRGEIGAQAVGFGGLGGAGASASVFLGRHQRVLRLGQARLERGDPVGELGRPAPRRPRRARPPASLRAAAAPPRGHALRDAVDGSGEPRLERTEFLEFRAVAHRVVAAPVLLCLRRPMCNAGAACALCRAVFGPLRAPSSWGGGPSPPLS
jgi:hypothetical protein